ncbi:MAG: hypothetical protein KF797_11095 [Flavobacteriales bacterium]|nr:hypothetical protein [Flavobacteriales bacterium]
MTTLHPRHPLLLLLAAALFPLCATAQRHTDKEEVSFITDVRRLPDRDRQEELRQWNGWPAFKARHPRWSAEFNEETGLPRRAYGDPIPAIGSTPVEQALRFLGEELAGYQLPLDELLPMATAPTGKLTYVHFEQRHAGLPVLGARAMVKLDGRQRVISFATDLVKDITTSLVPTTDAATAAAAARDGLLGVTHHEDGGLALLPVPVKGRHDVRLVHQVTVHTRMGERPGRYSCLVDAHTGRLWYRSNAVRTCDHGEAEDDANVDLYVTALAYPGNPLDAPVEVGLPDLEVSLGTTGFHTDITGYVSTGIEGPVQGTFALRGRWASVSTNNTTPSFTRTLNGGFSDVSFNNAANLRERSAYVYVNQIHAHQKAVLPTFTGMDLQMPTRLDLVTDNCNAFYDGSSINFYAEANGCRSLATINDVVYHEYGHGINDKFYLSLSSNFINGAMNEGYADVWAFTLTENPLLGRGMRLNEDNSFIRRYDIDPKVYPVHIVGEVHADGEIIAGAWWDTYRLLGNDMGLTLDLFAHAYPGLQAHTFNGNEGQAFRDVLLDVLQADDTDGDITNGTTHGAAIVEAFALHGITLISDALLLHDGLLAAGADQPIEIDARVVVVFPSTEYLDAVSLFYKVNDAADWTEVEMLVDDGTCTASIPTQPAGTLVSYHLGLRDIFGQASAVTPIAANRADPGLPHYILVGYTLAATENADDLNQLGSWQAGVPGDNAVTGMWELGTPLASYGTFGDPSTICQPGTQHTPGGEYCWYTGNAASITSPIGDNDVDDGSTTILGSNIDLSPYVDPAMSYWRWYTNNPPGGANPNTDWWQVYASSDNGATWVPVEDTKSGERNWRRKVFRVQDVLGDVTQIRLKFIVSDSIRLDQELEGGSLIEAAIDDIELWSRSAPDGVAEHAADRTLAVWPTPASDLLTVAVRRSPEPAMSMEVLDLTGRIVVAPRAVRGELMQLDVSGLADGQYVLRLRWNDGAAERRFSVLR